MPIGKPGAKPSAASKPPAAVAAKPGVLKKPVASGNGHDKAATNGHDVQAAPAAEHVEVRETVLQVQRRYPGAENSEETLEVRTFATRTASVAVSGKSRIGSIGQGGEVSVLVTVPCYQEELDDAAAFASEKVGEYLAVEQERLAELAGPEAMAQAGVGLDAEGLPENEGGEGEAEETGEEDEGDGGEQLTPDDVRALDGEEAILEFCQQQEIEIDLSEYGDLDEAKEAIVAYLWSEEGEAEGEGEAEAGEGDEESTGYTEEELSEMEISDIEALWPHWGINGGKVPKKAPKASDADHKKRLIAAVMKFQADAE